MRVPQLPGNSGDPPSIIPAFTYSPGYRLFQLLIPELDPGGDKVGGFGPDLFKPLKRSRRGSLASLPLSALT